MSLKHLHKNRERASHSLAKLASWIKISARSPRQSHPGSVLVKSGGNPYLSLTFARWYGSWTVNQPETVRRLRVMSAPSPCSRGSGAEAVTGETRCSETGDGSNRYSVLNSGWCCSAAWPLGSHQNPPPHSGSQPLVIDKTKEIARVPVELLVTMSSWGDM